MNWEHAKQSCAQVQSLLVAYLDGEVTPSEKALIRAHLSNCSVCQQELTLLSTAQSRVRSVLQRRAVDAVPLPEAWSRLEAKLPKVQVSFLPEAAQPSAKSKAWLSHLAPNADRASIQRIFGGVSMRKKFLASALGMLTLISTLVVFLARSVTPVSAQEVLDRAYEAKLQQLPAEGIGHLRSEIFSNIEGLPEDQGMKTIIDSYSDLETGYFRTVITDSESGRILEATAYDGTYTYSPDYGEERTDDEPLTIYRTPQDQVDLKPAGGAVTFNDQALFEQMRSDSHVISVARDTWEDGRTVYVLQSQQPVKVMVAGQTETPDGFITAYFDAETYKQIGYRMSMEKDGQEILLASQKILADEVLPAETSVAWDLSDLQGIHIVDDPDRTHGDLLPEVVTPQEMSEQASANDMSVYLLKDVPEGYSLEITSPPQQSPNEPYLYVASYRTEQNDYFVIQAATPADVDALKGNANETYTTANGLIVTFTQDLTSAGKTYVEAIVEAPNGAAFILSSTLPRDTVKAWAEKLVVVK